MNRRLRATAARIADGPLARRLRRAIGGAGGRFVSLAVWNSPELQLPWVAAAGDARAVDHAGWIVYHLGPLSGDSPRFRAVRTDAMSGAGCALFMLLALLAWWQGGRNWRVKSVLAASATLIALTIPAGFTPLGAGLWMGLMCGWTMRALGLGKWSARKSPATASQAPAEPGSGESRPGVGPASPSASGAAVAGLTVLMVLAFAKPPGAPAAEPSLKPAAAAPGPLYDVLIPADAEGHPVDKKCFVPEPLYDELSRRADHGSATSRNWLIVSAVYHGRLGRDASREGEAARNVTSIGDWMPGMFWKVGIARLTFGFPSAVP